MIQHKLIIILLFFLSTVDNTILRKLLIEQITCLQIDVKGKDKTTLAPSAVTVSTMFDLILSLCNRLIKLDFCHFGYRSTNCLFDILCSSYKSSTLTVLKISVEFFDDCLYLLDGRFNCLSTLIIHVEEIADTFRTTYNTVSMIVNYWVSETSFHFHRKNFPN